MGTVSKLERVALRSKRVGTPKGKPHPKLGERRGKGGGKKSKTKGGSYELAIAKLFRKWYGGAVERTPRSGGWQAASEFGLKADIVFGCKKARYHIECKKHEGWELEDLVTGTRSLESKSTNSIEKWWQQTISGCHERYVPMLIFSRNRRRDFLMVWSSDMDRLAGKDNHGWWAFLPHFRIQQDGMPERVVLCLDDFMKHVRPPKHAPNYKLWEKGV
jgi:hypothetical protein